MQPSPDAQVEACSNTFLQSIIYEHRHKQTALFNLFKRYLKSEMQRKQIFGLFSLISFPRSSLGPSFLRMLFFCSAFASIHSICLFLTSG